MLTVANAGDSRCVLCRKGKAIAMTEDHKPTTPEEHDRIMKVPVSLRHLRMLALNAGKLSTC